VGKENQPKASATYRPRRPEETVLYQAVVRNFRTFEALTELEGKRLPQHVTKEFESFLRCGILAYGFLRLRCEDCHLEKLLAFSCKKRGFCSSCGGRRMAESAAHLVDEVFPRVGVRQWVLSFPMPLRFILAQNAGFQARCLTIVHRAIMTYFQKKARRQGLHAPIQPGAVTLIQRFGGSLNLNVHYHMLFLEGGYYQTRTGPKFWRSGPPSDEDIQALVLTIAKRVIRFFRKKGYFQDEVDSAVPEKDLMQETLMPEILAASIQSRIAMGERKGGYVRRLGVIDRLQVERSGRLCAQVAGFSLHAAVYCKPWERAKLEMLCRYITRPAVAEERLELRPSGDIVLRLKTPYADGTSHLLFSGVEFVEKLAALIPPARIHLTRFFGCLAPHARIRSQIVPAPPQIATPAAAVPDSPPKTTSQQPGRTQRWAELLARVFGLDMQKCVDCGGNPSLKDHPLTPRPPFGCRGMPLCSPQASSRGAVPPTFSHQRPEGWDFSPQTPPGTREKSQNPL
jgi:hypothetical protein